MTTEHSGSGDLDRSLALLWDVGQQPTRGPKPRLTLDLIVRAAVTVADAEGMDGLSMRRVAAELGVGTMSLYRYIPGKAELLDLMLDHVSRPTTALENIPEAGWRPVMELMAEETWQLCIAHPWLLQVDQGRPLLGPNALGSVELILRGLADTGLSDRVKVMVIDVVDGYVTSMVRAHVNARQAEQRTGVTDDEFWEMQAPLLIKAVESGAYPTLATLAEDTFSGTERESYEFGLQCLLDGLEAYITRLVGGVPDTSSEDGASAE